MDAGNSAAAEPASFCSCTLAADSSLGKRKASGFCGGPGTLQNPARAVVSPYENRLYCTTVDGLLHR